MYCKECGADKIHLGKFGPVVIVRCRACSRVTRYPSLTAAREGEGTVWDANPLGYRKGRKKVYRHWEDNGVKASDKRPPHPLPPDLTPLPSDT